MKYELIAENGAYALIRRGESLQQYAVVNGLDKERGDWAWTCSYHDFGGYSKLTKEKALFYAADDFMARTDSVHIPYSRLLEIALPLKDGLVEDGLDEAYVYMCDVMGMSGKEVGLLGLDMSRYREEADFAGKYDTPSSACGGYGPSHPWDASGMSIKDFI